MKLIAAFVPTFLVLAAATSFGAETVKGKDGFEDFIQEPMPAGFRVVHTELDGPVFASKIGLTLYTWPRRGAGRNGSAGETKGKPVCDATKVRENAGLISPYPGGFEVPDVETRPSCIEVWPAAVAEPGAQPIGKWTIIQRPDGTAQWAYDGYAVYTSILDKRPGDVNGNSAAAANYADRSTIGPSPNIPPQFRVTNLPSGRLVQTKDSFSVYTWDRDGSNRSNCNNECLDEWKPVLAPDYSQSIGEWSTFERSPGIKQWAFRSKPVYTRVADRFTRSLDGSDVQGWHNVYTQPGPKAPRNFTVQETRGGTVLADSRGKTIYVYMCGEDTVDQLICDHPSTTQAYRLAVCGRKSDPADCLKNFPYVVAPANAKSESQLWTTIYIDPLTGREVLPSHANALHVWAFRTRPVYTFVGDQKPGDINADSWGEVQGKRNGFRAFWMRSGFESREN